MRCTSLCTLARVNIVRSLSSTSFSRSLSLISLLPSKLTRLIIGFSSTVTTRSLPRRSMRTSENKPVWNRTLIDSSIFSGL